MSRLVTAPSECMTTWPSIRVEVHVVRGREVTHSAAGEVVCHAAGTNVCFSRLSQFRRTGSAAPALHFPNCRA